MAVLAAPLPAALSIRSFVTYNCICFQYQAFNFTPKSKSYQQSVFTKAHHKTFDSLMCTQYTCASSVHIYGNTPITAIPCCSAVFYVLL